MQLPIIRVVATVIGRYRLFFENYVVYKNIHVLLCSLSFAVAKIYNTQAAVVLYFVFLPTLVSHFLRCVHLPTNTIQLVVNF